MQAKIWTERAERIKEEEIQKAIQEDELNQLQQIEQEWEQHLQQQEQEQVEAIEVSTESIKTASWKEIKIRVPKYEWETEKGAKEEIKLGPDVIAEKLKEKQMAHPSQ